MRRKGAAALLAAALSLGGAAHADGPPQTAAQWIRQLGLQTLDGEGGFFRVLRVSGVEVRAADGRSPASNAIYYLLTPKDPQNHLHWLASDDYQVLIDGGPADYYLFYPDGHVEHRVMGHDVAAGQTPFVAVPADTTKAIVLRSGAPYVLVGSVVTPAWSPKRVRIGAGAAFVERYAGASDWATPAFLRTLIGPNFKQGDHASGKNFAPLEPATDAAGRTP
ncbi:cupin domain-containing protein [Solimonas marina]|nr:cupin domain-containing protein [Solimonas marina]